jgi:hypothetical protein
MYHPCSALFAAWKIMTAQKNSNILVNLKSNLKRFQVRNPKSKWGCLMKEKVKNLAYNTQVNAKLMFHPCSTKDISNLNYWYCSETALTRKNARFLYWCTLWAHTDWPWWSEANGWPAKLVRICSENLHRAPSLLHTGLFKLWLVCCCYHVFWWRDMRDEVCFHKTTWKRACHGALSCDQRPRHGHHCTVATQHLIYKIFRNTWKILDIFFVLISLVLFQHTPSRCSKHKLKL